MIYAPNKHSFNMDNIYKFLKTKFNIEPQIKDNSFIIKKNGRIFVTPLFMALTVIEITDLIFAIDSIPVIFAITQNTYIVYTSNIFAILGLRALFFCLDNIVDRFKYLKYSLAIILILIGIKIFAAHFIEIPAYIPFAATVILLTGGIVVSIVKTRKLKVTK
jgi:tellurite resistance protein TerC